MEQFLALGFVVGMGHALEADHLAAVGALSTKKTSRRRLALLGATWGLGHTITLFALCSAVIFLGLVLTERLSAALEFTVGIMLVVLGLHVVFKMRQKKVHFHVHDHGDGSRHIHAHSHEEAKVSHEQDAHEHKHANGFPLKSFMVGLAHGAAGSAGLIALALAATRDSWAALGYVAAFGIGSMLGMALLTLAASWPLRYGQSGTGWIFKGLQMAIAAIAIWLGVSVMLETGPIAFNAA
ncbi:MAG: urease accessory protein [Hyphomicrobiales bacterium]